MKTHQPLSLPHLPYPSLVPPPSHPHSPYPSISPFKKGENTPTFLKGTLFSSRFGEGVLKRKGAFPPTQPKFFSVTGVFKVTHRNVRMHDLDHQKTKTQAGKGRSVTAGKEIRKWGCWEGGGGLGGVGGKELKHPVVALSVEYDFSRRWVRTG